MKLSDYLAANRITNEGFAKMLGTSQPAVSRYVTGKRVPRPQHIRRISEITGGEVTANDFMAPSSSTRSADQASAP
jgi:predicted transcriptional regulator